MKTRDVELDKLKEELRKERSEKQLYKDMATHSREALEKLRFDCRRFDTLVAEQ